MNPRYELLMLDWDGTLVDSEAIIIGSMRTAFGSVGEFVPSEQAVRGIIGLGMREAIETLSPGIDSQITEQITARYRDEFFGASVPPQLYPGVKDALRRLRDLGYRLAVATGKGRPGLDKGIVETGLEGMFEITRCASETRSKPHPEMLHQILDSTWVEPARALMVGDTTFDLEMAAAAGCPAVAVCGGAHGREQLVKHDPIACLDSFNDLPDWLEANNTNMADHQEQSL